MKKAAVMLYPLFSLQEISCLTELFLFHGKEIVTYAAERAPVRSEDGFTVLPDRSFQDFCREEIDCLVLPGIWEPLPVLGPCAGYVVLSLAVPPCMDCLICSLIIRPRRASAPRLRAFLGLCGLLSPSAGSSPSCGCCGPPEPLPLWCGSGALPPSFSFSLWSCSTLASH